MRFSRLVPLLVLGPIFVACQRDEPEPLVPAAGTVQAIDRSVDEISTARCDREQRCGGIGPEQSYSDREHCMNVMREKARADLNRCRSGLDDEDVRECLTEIRNQDCSGVFDSLEQFTACSLDDLCRD